MKCEGYRDSIVLLHYGELPDEFAVGLEQHLVGCEDCRRELNAMRTMDEQLASMPVTEPQPNLLAQSRMRLDDALDQIPPHGLLTRLRSHWFRWLGNLQSAPALATLLLGVGFLGGNFTYRYQVAHEQRPKPAVVLTNETNGSIANVTGITRTPDSELVQVNYNRVVPETVEGSLDDPGIRKLLMMGMEAGASNGVRADSVALIANECKAGHRCAGDDAIRNALLVSLRYDKNPGVRMKALTGLEHYVSQDQRVRDGVLEALMSDPDADVRKTAIGMLGPVQSDSSVRQVLRTTSLQDNNPFIRTASYQALQGAGDFQ
jgi:HEAT repeats